MSAASDGKKHGPTPASQFACQQAGKNDGRSAGKGGQQPQCPQRGTDGVLQEPRDPRDQRRLIDISPGGMFSARQVVELIAKVSVVGSGKEVENDAHQGDVHHDGRSRGEGRGLPDCAYGAS